MIENVRQFKLINRTGAEYDLTRVGALLINPQGLGYTISASIERLGRAFNPSNEFVVNPSPTGDIVFHTYDEYNNFLDFIQKGGCVLAYKPVDIWRYLDCIVSVDKTEISAESNRLICPVRFDGVSYWYEKINAVKAENTGSGGKVYGTATYPYNYTSGGSGETEIKNGNRESYFKLTIYGECENPTYYLYQDGARIHTGKILTTIASNEMLVINSNPVEAEISVYTKDGTFVRNAYGLSDFTTERLFSIPSGTSTFVFTQDGTGDVNAIVEVRKNV